MDLSKLSRYEAYGAVASVLLVVSLLFIPWYDLEMNQLRVEDGDGFICGVGEFSCTGWETFPILRWFLLLAALAPLILAYIVSRGNQLSWPPREMTMLAGFIAFVLIFYNGVLDTPGSQLAEVGVSKQIGYYLALLASVGIAAAGIARATESQGRTPRKTPGTV